MGKRLKAKIEQVEGNIERLYNNLGNIAFWDAIAKANAAPVALDWGNPKHTVTLSLNLTHAVVKYNGEAKSNGDTIPNIEESSTIQLSVEAESGYELDSISSQAGTVNGSTVSLVIGTSDATLDITASASSAYSISYDLSNCEAPTGATNPTAIRSGETKTIYLEAAVGYTMPASLPSGAVTGASYTYTRDSQDNTKATIALSTPTDNVAIAVTATQVQTEQVNLTMKKVTAYGAQYGTQGNGDTETNTYKVPMTLANLNGSAPECSLSNTSYVDGQAFSATVIPATGYSIFSVKVTQNSQDITGESYNPAAHTINVDSPDSSLSIEVVVAAATNGLFKNGSFFGCAEGSMSYFSIDKAGQIVSDPARDGNLAWQCNSEFIVVPQGTTHVKWTVADSAHIPYSSNPTRAAQHQRTLIWYDENFVPFAFLTYWDISNPYRILDMSTNQALSAAKFLRASYVEGYGKIEFSSDGTNFTTAWEYTED